MTTSEQIIAGARSWIDTPFHHQARLKGVGCDCLGFLIGVASVLDLRDASGMPLAAYDEVAYSKEPDGAYLTQKLMSLLPEIPLAHASAGNIALFKVRENPQHLAILTNYEGGLGMIHSFAPSRRVVEHRLDDEWKSRMIKVFRWQQSY